MTKKITKLAHYSPINSNLNDEQGQASYHRFVGSVMMQLAICNSQPASLWFFAPMLYHGPIKGTDNLHLLLLKSLDVFAVGLCCSMSKN